MSDLKLYEGSEPVVMSATTMLDIMKAIITTEGMEEKYREEMKTFNQHIEVHPELVNAAKKIPA